LTLFVAWRDYVSPNPAENCDGHQRFAPGLWHIGGAPRFSFYTRLSKRRREHNEL
jgi:hypothetical protein